MTDDARVEELLEELLESGGTPEEVCRNCPELLPQVRAGWQRLRALEAEVGALFPASTVSNDTATPILPTTELPRIHGYEVQGVLGRGGMGIVYKAWHLRLNRAVALKMLLAGPYARPEELERFLREAEAVAGLRHANVVQIYDVGDLDGRPYFTMEFVEGGSLAQKAAGTPQPAGWAASLVTTLAEAIQVAHQSGIVHRDLTPANVLLTADGTPKITDFGLARRLEGGGELTLSGVPMGTPSYMAPEQAQGQKGAVGPAADIYGLGAILYELLTGRPPFRAETATATLQQVLADDPVRPARLNPRVPRDLETICLKCLQKSPARRYASAAALAEDLLRFQRGESIAARPASRVERTGKWVRRHPTASAMLAASFLLAVVLVGIGFYLVVQRTHQRHAVETDLKELAELQDRARWAEAHATLERAEARFGEAGPNDLRRRIAQGRRDLDLVIRLDNIRLKRATRGELAFYKAVASKDYADAFEQEGLGKVHDPPASVAAAVRASAVRGALVAALDDWAVCIAEKDQRDWLLEVVRLADPDPEGWRDRIQDPRAWDDPGALAKLARMVPVARGSVSLLLALGERLTVAHRDATPLLKRVQKENPDDFWANLVLGNALLPFAPQEAEGYYRAALSIRPQAAVGYCAVGDALRRHHDLAEAIEYYRQALQLDAGYARAHSDLGLTLQEQGRLDEAIPCYRQAVQLDPDYAWGHHNLANALRTKGLLDEACEQSQKAIQLDPNNAEIKACLTSVLLRLGREQEALDVWRTVIDANPADYRAWLGYAEFYLFLGQQEEYRRIRRELLDRFAKTNSQYIAEPIGRACLLLPGTEDELRRAVTLIDRAVAAKESTPEWIYPFILFAKGLAEYRQGRWASAISLMQGKASTVMWPVPRLIVAMSQFQQGQKREARQTLAQAVIAYDWSAARADNRDIWISHILRREAETLILPNLPAFLEGKYQPRDNDERLALLGICQFKDLRVATASLYAAAFAADPNLAEDLPTGHRYNAARAAAQVGSGADGAKLSEGERVRWRKQACAWLRADLDAWASKLESGPAADRAKVQQALARWRSDPDLAGLCDPEALDRLPEAERQEWRLLWSDLDALLERAQALKERQEER